MKLSEQVCEACAADSPRLNDGEIKTLLEALPQWTQVERNGVQQLERSYVFPDFVSALAFTNKVGGLAEEAGHHPALLTEWGKVTVTWWTHTVRGLHKNDFILAARTDEMAPG